MRLLALRSVLVAVDDDPGGDAAIATAADLARLAGGSLHIVQAAAATGVAAESALAARASRVAPGCDASATVMVGSAPEAIATAAANVRADVIVLGPHRGGGGGDRSLGATAGRVVRESSVPCLIVPAPMRLPLHSILVPIDLSEAARGALAVALAWSSALRRPGAEGGDRTRLTVLHVVGARDDPAGIEALRAEVEGVRSSTASFVGVAVEEVEERSDDVAGGIDRVAERTGAGLVVMGTRGGGGGAEPLGSVSSAVVRPATRPVLLVPPSHARQHADDLDAVR
jgi:nucleotide-binding universal stress UspA family protein